MQRVVIMNAKRKMNTAQASEWFACDELTIIRAIRESERCKKEEIYILGACGNYGINKGDVVDYITDTGNGYGGKGKLYIFDVMTSGKKYNNQVVFTQNIMNVDEKIKLPIWVFK